MTVKNPLAKYNRSNLIFIGVSIAASLALSALAEVVIFGLLHCPFPPRSPRNFPM